MIAPIPEILDELRAGRMVILVDDEDRENEGDLVMAAEKATAEAVNFMAVNGRGLICLALTGRRLEELQIPPMVSENTARFGTAFHISIDAAAGVSTGISAADRARTIQTAIDPASKPSDLARPGHVFPLRAREGGVLVRIGQTEGSVDLAAMAGLDPSAVICEVMNPDGSMARLPQLLEFARLHSLKICTVQSVIEHRCRTERLVHRVVETPLPTDFGNFNLLVYETRVDRKHHLALVKGHIDRDGETLVRVHSECLTGDAFHSRRCDCGGQLHRAMEMINEAGVGVLVYMRQEGRGIGLLNKIRAYQLQDRGMDTVEANIHLGFEPDPREYGMGAQILMDLGVRKMRLISNNPVKRAGLEGYGLQVTSRVPIEIPPNDTNRDYLRAKKEKLGHLLEIS